jgi:hypothetical protein
VPVLVQPEEGDNVFVQGELLGREDGEDALYDAAVERSLAQILTVWPMGGSRAQCMGDFPEADIFAKIGGSPVRPT